MRKYVIAGVLMLFGAFAVSQLLAAGMKPFAKSPALPTITLEVPALPDAATKALIASLAKQKGIQQVTLKAKSTHLTAQIDESVLPASAFAALVNDRLNAQAPKQSSTAKLVTYVDAPMCAGQKTMCGGCFTEIPARLKAVKGIAKVTLDKTGRIATIDFAPKAKVTTGAIADALKKSSFKFTVAFADPKTAPKTGGMTCKDGVCTMPQR